MVCQATTTPTTTTTTTMTTTTTTEMPCPTDWEKFERPSGPWCVKLFVGLYLQGNRNEASARCATEGAVLSGVQNKAELNAMISQFTRLGNGYFWVGAMRKTSCLMSQLTATCTALNSFEWTDGSTTGTDGFIWKAGDPNNYQYNLYDEPCVAADVNLMEDIACTRTDVTGYACGKPL
ncbi:C-type lectin domain-containing protein [Caenorhabditis elegans]|uniref:C-type lectin domain-containing protein n=1 Tax=Caenorhabditis elegans TaxID=6239 RepID=A0A0M7REL6_CAEEL|nr:C-type lectin domain-containing protein [Caenorhabditis elegans]CUR29980.1 C-type lectin domain-containing protein [Caenorhabditis elegans]|eukprot:NP_001303785.1 C-type LECtin [Caenorhabditis elegans]